MQFAFVHGARHEPSPGILGTCPMCGSSMVSKCGPKVVWHWAHACRVHCDPWWENETEWHRNWKGCFPVQWREQVHFAQTGEKHIADVKTPSGLVLEFQNSPMGPEELESRERFYGTMHWIVNGLPFIDQFYVLNRLPAPNAPWTRDIVFYSQQAKHAGAFFWRLSENPNHRPGELVQVHSISEIQHQVDDAYVGHHLYDWVRPRTVWSISRMPVYIDFGGDLLWQMQSYDSNGLKCIHAIRKAGLVHSLGGRYAETGQIALTAKPINRASIVDKGGERLILDAIR